MPNSQIPTLQSSHERTTVIKLLPTIVSQWISSKEQNLMSGYEVPLGLCGQQM